MKISTEELKNIEKRIVNAIIGNLKGRSGYRQTWDDTSEDVQEEIKNCWKKLVRRILDEELSNNNNNNNDDEYAVQKDERKLFTIPKDIMQDFIGKVMCGEQITIAGYLFKTNVRVNTFTPRHPVVDSEDCESLPGSLTVKFSSDESTAEFMLGGDKWYLHHLQGKLAISDPSSYKGNFIKITREDIINMITKMNKIMEQSKHELQKRILEELIGEGK